MVRSYRGIGIVSLASIVLGASHSNGVQTGQGGDVRLLLTPVAPPKPMSRPLRVDQSTGKSL